MLSVLDYHLYRTPRQHKLSVYSIQDQSFVQCRPPVNQLCRMDGICVDSEMERERERERL